ncbi:MAG: DUF4376 domain-containing protein [Gallionella sp.]|nr:DUF4376 domain-containing protein [Gallionella sp.]
MTIATTNQVFIGASGEIHVVYAGQYIDPSYLPWIAPVQTSAQLLASAQAAKIELLSVAYANAITQPVSYTSKSGMAETYQADSNSQSNLMKELAVYQSAGATPTGYYWVAANNTQVPFTLADLQGLAAAMGAQEWQAFQHLQTLKASVSSGTTVTAVQAIVW